MKEQRGTLCLWAIVDPDMPEGELEIAIKGTGHQCDNITDGSWRYLSTVVTDGGSLVWHVFYRTDVPYKG